MRLLAIAPLLFLPLACGGSEDTSIPVTDAGSDVTVDAAIASDSGPSDSMPADSMPADSMPADSAPTDVGTPVVVDPLEGAAAATKVKGGFGFTEGTAWNAAGGFLLFSDIPNDTIFKLVPPSTFTTFKKPSGKSNGLAWTADGKLVACEHGNRRVSRSNADGTGTVTIADLWGGKKLNSPNDAIVRSDGNLYFSDPDYGLEGRAAELTFRGVFRVDPKGVLSLVDDTMNEPNGVALSPDEKSLYVGDSGTPKTWRWNVAPDGSVSGKTLFASEGSDGMAIDDAGNVYLTTAAGVAVYKPGGEKWGTVPVPEQPANVAFGGADRRTLFIAARTSIYSVVLKVPGKP